MRVSSHFSVRDPRLGSLCYPLVVPTKLETDADQTYTTDLTLCGLVLRKLGASRTDTLPTAADLVEAVQGCMVDTSFDFIVKNTSTGAYTITVAAGTGGTAAGTMTIAQNYLRLFKIVFTNVTSGSEAYTLYSLGTLAF